MRMREFIKISTPIGMVSIFSLLMFFSPRDSCCIQYLTGCTGRIMTFNFDNVNDNHLNNQQYTFKITIIKRRIIYLSIFSCQIFSVY